MKRGPRKKECTIETVEIPRSTADFVSRRLSGVVDAVWSGWRYFDRDFLKALTLSCYLQGVNDMMQMVEHYPDKVQQAMGPVEVVVTDYQI